MTQSNRQSRHVAPALASPLQSRLHGRIAAALGITALLLLSACHTTAGAGEDISAAGHALTHSAQEHTP